MSSRRDTLKRISAALSELYPQGEADAVARALVAEREGITLSHLLAFSADECTVADEELEHLTAELASGRPLQYVLGHCTFCGLDFEVGEGVLIPRPETELLVDAAARRTPKGAAVLDLCTGSGCIAVALAKRIDKASVTAIDISEKALDCARRNARRNDICAEFIRADIFGELPLGAGLFDTIVSNPPYVPMSDKASMHINVLGFEPHEALFVPDERPLIFYERIAQLARTLLRDGGWLCFEIHERYAESMLAMLGRCGYTDITLLEDANLKPRTVCCRK